MRVLSFLSRHHVDKYESQSGKTVGYLMKKKISIKSFKAASVSILTAVRLKLCRPVCIESDLNGYIRKNSAKSQYLS